MNYLEIVSELNQELFDVHGEVEEQFFYTSSGYIDIIGFGDIALWDSENESRSWDDDKNCYPNLKPHIKMLLNDYGKRLIKYTTD